VTNDVPDDSCDSCPGPKGRRSQLHCDGTGVSVGNQYETFLKYVRLWALGLLATAASPHSCWLIYSQRGNIIYHETVLDPSKSLGILWKYCFLCTSQETQQKKKKRSCQGLYCLQ
jgi:hypothetical protein